MDGSALITGGTGGLGAAVTRAFLDAGWRVVVPIFDERERERVSAHARLVLEPADLGDPESANAVAQLAAGDGDAVLRAVVNLVGGFAAGQPVAETPIEEFERMFTLNLRTTYLVTQAALARLSPDGAVVCVSSAAARNPFAGAAGYAASKAAVAAFARTLAAEGVRCNVIVPTVIDTPANRASMPNARMVPAEQIAAVILFLCSPAAAAVNGAEIEL